MTISQTTRGADTVEDDADAKNLLELRVEALEQLSVDLARRARSLRQMSIGIGAGALVLGAALGWGLAARTQQSVRAQQFVVGGADGAVHAMFGRDEDGATRLRMMDTGGQERLRLVLLADGSPGLTFRDGAGRARMVFGFLPDETANLTLADGAGNTRVVLGLARDGSSTLVFADPAGRLRMALGLDANGRPTYQTVDQPGASSAPPPPPAEPETDAAVESTPG